MVTLWEDCLLSDVVRFGNGKAIKPGGTGLYPVFGSNGIIGGSDEFLHENGVVIGRVGAYCGAVVYCPTKFWASDNTLVAYPSSEQVDTQFLYRLLVDANLSRYAGGAAQPLVTQTVLKQVEVRIPELDVQLRIAGVLAAYDELIENSQRRIKILESMARALYREWFVYFRYPGHESVPLVPSSLGDIPQGWDVRELRGLFDFVGGSQPPKIEHVHEEQTGFVRFIQNRDYGSSNHLTYIADSRTNKYCERLDIMVDKYGDPGRTRFGLAGAYNVALAKILPHESHHLEWLRGLFSEPDFKNYLAGASMAATRASLNSSHFIVSVAVPPLSVTKSFGELVEPLLKLLLSHQDSIANLRRTRDLLLPRLLSGQIDLEAVAA